MRRSQPLLLLPLTFLVACAEDSDPTGPLDEGPAVLTVDASEDWGFVTLGEPASSVAVGAPGADEVWDIAFFATSVMLNGGAAGPAGVTGHCLCRNAAASDTEILGMSAATELAAFEAVTAADVPSEGSAWSSDALSPAIDGWYSYDVQTHTVSAAPENVWKVRTASGDAFAKLHVIAIDGATQEHAGRVTFEYALQPEAGAAFEEPRTWSVDLSSGDVHFDLESGSVVTSGDEWDLHFDGYDVRVNGGVSGDGRAGASLSGESFDAVADASDLTAGHYMGDAFGGVFDEHPWYRYDLEGNHQIWPTFDVYLVKRADAVYKIQITSYYGPTGDARQVSFRYARLD